MSSQKVSRTPRAKDGKDEKVWTGGEKATPLHLHEKCIVGVGYKAFRPILCALCVRHLLNEVLTESQRSGERPLTGGLQGRGSPTNEKDLQGWAERTQSGNRISGACSGQMPFCESFARRLRARSGGSFRRLKRNGNDSPSHRVRRLCRGRSSCSWGRRSAPLGSCFRFPFQPRPPACPAFFGSLPTTSELSASSPWRP